MIKWVLALLSLSTSCASMAASLADGQDAYDQNRIGDAERLFEAVAADPAAPVGDKAQADLALARIAWLIDDNADVALKRIDAARRWGGKSCDVGVMTLRVLSEAKRDQQAIAAEPALVRSCGEPQKNDSMRVHAITARLDRAMALPDERASLLQQAQADAALLTKAANGDGARVRLETALLTADASAAIEAWKDYYWLIDSDGPPALSQYHPASLFKKGLRRNASDTDRVELAYLLMRAGFADGLQRYVTAHGLPGRASNTHWTLVQTYLAQHDRLIQVALEVNRVLARGGSKDNKRLQQTAMQSLGALMAAAGAQGDPKKAIADYYGLVGSVGLTSGYPSLHIGHLVEDRTETVQQYGHQATIRFQVIDNMWANGFESWLWDGSASTGGWSGDDTIIQVRSGYTSGPVAAYALVGNTPSRREQLAEFGKLSIEDLAKARGGSPTTLQGLNIRLRLQLIDQIAAVARKTAGTGNFRRAFLEEYWRANNQQSIFVHEGRHAIDKSLAGDRSKLDDTTLEYQANLSELALSDYPRMALWNLNHGIGGSTPHEQASTRIIKHLSEWIEANPGKVAGYDPAIPAAVQIDKLTDNQLREIARSLDPLAKAAAATASTGSRS
jgi:hypothetical protein